MARDMGITDPTDYDFYKMDYDEARCVRFVAELIDLHGPSCIECQEPEAIARIRAALNGEFWNGEVNFKRV